jgi:hypothetical protein
VSLPAWLGGLAAGLRRRALFTWYYATNVWRDPESRSGPGSRRDSGQVRHSLDVLSEIVERHGVRSLADIPCGDFNWMGAFLAARPQLDYAGYDIVAPLIASNRRKAPGRRFERLDIVTEIPPAADLIFCKDMINHLSAPDIVASIDNMRRSGSTWLLATNNFGYVYEDLKLEWVKWGSSRHVDLTAAPFNYPAPLWQDHYLALWRLSDMTPAPSR